MTNKEELQARLEKLNGQLTNPKITANKGLLTNLKNRIAFTEKELAETETIVPVKVVEPKKEQSKRPAKEPKVAKVKVEKVKSVKKEKVEKPKKEVATNLTKKEIEELKERPKVAKILEIIFPKHLVQYKLHLAGLSTEEIMVITGSPKPATIRNIWYYTSGKKSL